MPHADNINATIEVLKGLRPEEFSMQGRDTCICQHAPCETNNGPLVEKWLGLDHEHDSGDNDCAVCPPSYQDEPLGGNLYPIPVAIRMLEIARDENVVDWQRARKEVRFRDGLKEPLI